MAVVFGGVVIATLLVCVLFCLFRYRMSSNRHIHSRNGRDVNGGSGGRRGGGGYGGELEMFGTLLDEGERNKNGNDESASFKTSKTLDSSSSTEEDDITSILTDVTGTYTHTISHISMGSDASSSSSSSSLDCTPDSFGVPSASSLIQIPTLQFLLDPLLPPSLTPLDFMDPSQDD